LLWQVIRRGSGLPGWAFLPGILAEKAGFAGPGVRDKPINE